jgi:hypothetical protein
MKGFKLSHVEKELAAVEKRLDFLKGLRDDYLSLAKRFAKESGVPLDTEDAPAATAPKKRGRKPKVANDASEAPAASKPKASSADVLSHVTDAELPGIIRTSLKEVAPKSLKPTGIVKYFTSGQTSAISAARIKQAVEGMDDIATKRGGALVIKGSVEPNRGDEDDDADEDNDSDEAEEPVMVAAAAASESQFSADII